MTRVALDGDPPDWGVFRRLALVCLLADGRVVLRPDGTLPSDQLAAGEHPLDACLRIPLAQAGFRYQHFHLFAAEDQHLFAWVVGDLHHARTVEPRLLAAADATTNPVVAEAVANHARLMPETYFADATRTLERAYLLATTPQRQSGFGGGKALWRGPPPTGGGRHRRRRQLPRHRLRQRPSGRERAALVR